MEHKTLAELSKALQNKEISSVELTQFYLDRINKFDEKLNSFITVCDEHALNMAKAADARIQSGNFTALTGIPVAQKDIFCTQGIKTSCGSKMLDNFIAPYESTVTHKFNEAGAVMIGKTNMDEFAMGSSNENSYYGAVQNPWKNNTVPGGSSGGSASAVAARLAAAATGTDTGGSIRQPAALCGITGLKPTYGRVSRYGMIAFASSLDQGGPMTQTAEDAAMVLNVMAGHDVKDSTCINKDVPDYTSNLNDSIKGLRIGVPEEYIAGDIEADVAKCIEETIKTLRSMGAEIKTVKMPHTKVGLSAYYIIAPAEASSNLARYDGVRYGYRCNDPKNLEDMYTRTRSEGFGDEVKRRIMTGTYALSAGYYDAYYLKAQQIRKLISEDYKQAFKDVDVILTPTSPSTTFEIGAVKDPISMYLTDVFTIPANLAGLPGISFPCGMANNLPVGVQLVGNYFEEAKLLNVAHQYQQETNWHTMLPEGYSA